MSVLTVELLAAAGAVALTGFGTAMAWLFLTVSRNSGLVLSLDKRWSARIEDLDRRWSERIDDLDRRWSEHEKQIPTAKDVHELTVALTELRGDMRVQAERTKMVGHIVDRHERWLDEGRLPGG